VDPRPADVARDAVVVRFSPFSYEGIAKSARTSARHYMNPDHPDEARVYRISVFAAVKRPGESADDLLLRLARAAQLSGIQLERNAVMQVGSAGTLLDERFTFWKDGYKDELGEHYSVDFGPDEPDVSQAQRFLRAFPDKDRRATPQP